MGWESMGSTTYKLAEYLAGGKGSVIILSDDARAGEMPHMAVVHGNPYRAPLCLIAPS